MRVFWFRPNKSVAAWIEFRTHREKTSIRFSAKGQLTKTPPPEPTSEAFDPPFVSVFVSDEDDLENEFKPLWDQPTMLRLACALYEHPHRSSLEKKLFKLRNQTRVVKELLHHCIDLDHPSELLSFVYWHEFKQIRDEFQDRYRNAVQVFERNKSIAAERLFEELSADYRFDRELAKMDLRSAVMKLISAEKVCAICMQQVCDACFIHKDRGCMVCRKCAEQFDERVPCPFCREPIERAVITNL